MDSNRRDAPSRIAILSAAIITVLVGVFIFAA
jgi:hypothetical protein